MRLTAMATLQTPRINQGPQLGEPEYQRLAALIHRECGIRMPPAKKVLLRSRLLKRLRALQFDSFREYMDFLASPEGRATEVQQLIDTITTNKTDFFRDPKHFEFLVQTVLPELVRQGLCRSRRPLAVWSAGCSSGEEPFTLAMVLSEFAEAHPGFQSTILGTDICTKVLAKAQAAVYDHGRVEPVPLPLRKKYLLRSKDRSHLTVRIGPRLRAMVTFRQLNLMAERFEVPQTMDVIFFRNVLIYFNRPEQEYILNRLCAALNPSGYLFMGPSETLNGMCLPLTPVGPTVYRKINGTV